MYTVLYDTSYYIIVKSGELQYKINEVSVKAKDKICDILSRIDTWTANPESSTDDGLERIAFNGLHMNFNVDGTYVNVSPCRARYVSKTKRVPIITTETAAEYNKRVIPEPPQWVANI